MCNQTVSLIAAECERQGMSTVTIQFIYDLAERLRPPRALVVPYRHGYPLGLPNDAARQRSILEKALLLLTVKNAPPILNSYEENA